MRILVTGANGFVGLALCEHLARAGIACNAAVRAPGRTTRDPDVAPHIVGDIDANTDWSQALACCDAVIHLAARVHIHGTSDMDLAAARITNRDGTATLARQAVQAGVSRFVFCSTVKVLGEGRAAAYTDDDLPAPHDAYAISKLEAEQELEEIARNSTMSFTVIRPPLVYGPRVGANFLRLLAWTAAGVPLPLACARNQRSLIYVDNLTDVLLTAASHPAAANRKYLVADHEPLSTPELIRSIASAGAWPARLLPCPVALLAAAARLTGKTRSINSLIGSLWVDHTRITRELDWRPRHATRQGLAETVNWYKREILD